MNWRFLDTGFNNPYKNMAIDETLVHLLSVPVLRFFDWTEPCISIGFSQRVGDVLNVDLCGSEKVSFVRRPTGGGVVFHGSDITYSVILPEGFVKDIYEGYILVQSNILNGLKKLGINANLYEKIEKQDLKSHCFVTPNFGDIIADRRKLCGLAARRIKQRMLYQGYIYATDASDMQKFCRNKFPDEKAVSLDTLGVEKARAKGSIISNWPGKLIKDSLTEEGEMLAEELLGNKYSSDEWNYKR